MLFNSLVFLFAFLPVTYAVFWCLRSTTQRHVWLTITGYVFYGYWDPRFCLLMAFTTSVSYLAGLGFLATDDPRSRRLLLIVPISLDLLLLGYFKYAGFFLRSTGALIDFLGWQVDIPLLEVILPIGISFYTFHTITYIVDAYRRVIVPTRSFWEFSAYVSLFSQLVAGPIVRFREVEADLGNIDRASRRAGLLVGLSFLAYGMFEKVLVADSLAYYVDPWLEQYRELSSLAVWQAMLGYTFQLYFDFSGYSSMAIGLGLLFGIRIPQNFNSPYLASNPSDFWRRWHISLSRVLKDYLYIPLGGGKGSSLLTYRNLLITMLIGGLWHGASWTFVAWGAYHGLLLAAYRFCGARVQRVPVWAARTTTFLAVVVGWVLFRATDFSMASNLLAKMFSWTPGLIPEDHLVFFTFTALAMAVAFLAPNAMEYHRSFRPQLGRVAATGLVLGLAVAVIAGRRASPFLYFQF